MTRKRFAAWALERGVPGLSTEQLLRYAASAHEMREAFEAMVPAPPVHTLDDIVKMTDEDPYRINPLANGFVLVGGCPNGDRIAIDLTDEPGSIWYICHETMWDVPVREASIRVAKDLKEMMKGMAGSDFPCDYFEGKERHRPSAEQARPRAADPQLYS